MQWKRHSFQHVIFMHKKLMVKHECLSLKLLPSTFFMVSYPIFLQKTMFHILIATNE